MSNDLTNQCVSRRRLFSLIGAVATVGLAVPVTMLVATSAEAQTVGMDRRQDRREGRRDRRDDRRQGREDRRNARRGNTTVGSSTAAPK